MSSKNPYSTNHIRQAKDRQLIAAYEEQEKRNSRERAKGLVLWCISHRKPKTTVSLVKVYAGMIKLKPLAIKEQPVQLQSTRRGACKGFSRASRKRMIEAIMKLRGLKNMCFITLTYPKIYPTDWRVWKKHLDNFIKRLRRRFPASFGLWRLELQKRGAPHFHLLLAEIIGDWDEIVEWLTKAWAEIAHIDDKYKGQYATKFERLTGRKHALYYVSKYAAKESEKSIEMGRVWGMTGECNQKPIAVFGWDVLQAKKARAIAHTMLVERGSKYADDFFDIPHDYGWTFFGVGDEPIPKDGIISIDQFLDKWFLLTGL